MALVVLVTVCLLSLIVAGVTSRSKTVRVAGDPRQLIARLSAEIASLPGS